MGFATVDPHNQKAHTEIHKIPKFGVNQASFDWVSFSFPFECKAPLSGPHGRRSSAKINGK